MATTDIYTIAGSLTPVRSALRFLGGNVDDGVTVNALGAAMCAGNHTKGTITAWVMVADIVDSTGYTIFSLGDNDSANEFLEFTILTGKLKFKINDGGATRVDVATTSAVLTPHKWHNVALVQDGMVPYFYVDGVQIPQDSCTYATTTEITQWLDDLDGIDN